MVGKNVSSRVKPCHRILFTGKPCQTVSGRESTSPPATPIRALAKACQTVSNRVKPCNRTLLAGKTVSNRVGERVGKLSLFFCAKPCQTVSPDPISHKKSEPLLAKVCQAVSIRKVGKLRPCASSTGAVAKPCQTECYYMKTHVRPCWGGVGVCKATASAANYMP